MRTEYEQLSTRIKKDESNQTKSLETLIQEVVALFQNISPHTF